MASHRSTPATVLDAPVLRPLLVWADGENVTVRHGDHTHTRRRGVPFTGDVEERLLGRQVGISRKGRKIRRPTTKAL